MTLPSGKRRPGEEYQHWRNEWLKAGASIRERIVASDRVFYGRQGARA